MAEWPRAVGFRFHAVPDEPAGLLADAGVDQEDALEVV
jgi:hypothetical protein